MKNWYVYCGGILVDVVKASSAVGACRIAAGRTVYQENELEASSVVK